MTPQHPQLAELMTQYHTATRERVDLLARRRRIIEEYHRTKVKSAEFHEVMDALGVNEQLMTVLRNAVAALAHPGNAQ